MAHQTEAACLLQTGAQYPRRLGLKQAASEDELVFAGFKHGAFSIYFGDEPIAHFDLEGRWQRFFQGGIHYLKALDTTTVALERIRERGHLILHRRSLSETETTELDASIRARVTELLEGCEAGRLQRVDPPENARPIHDQELRSVLEQISRWDTGAWTDHRSRYQSTYSPLGFLPPEAQQAVILQATMGAAEGFTFGRVPAGAHDVRSQSSFDRHAQSVSDLLGKRLFQFRSALIGGSDLLRLPIDEVAGYLRTANRVFPVEPAASHQRLGALAGSTPRLAGFHAFLDCFEPPLPSLDDWRHLSEPHLRRVILGIESGDVEVRAIYGKHWKNETLKTIVADLKAADVEISVVTLVGAGGREQAESHELASAALLNALPLGPGDLVYLLNAVEVGGDAVRELLHDRDLSALTGREFLEQQQRLLAALKPVRTERQAKVVPYSLEKQWS
jgi:hypothetical protein